MISYHYSTIQCYNPRARGEMRNIGVFMVSQQTGYVEVHLAPLSRILPIKKEESVAIHAYIEDLLAEAQRMMNPLSGQRKDVVRWMMAMASQRENSVRFAEVSCGLAQDLSVEAGRLLEMTTGYNKADRPQKGVAHQAVKSALHSKDMTAYFEKSELWIHQTAYPFTRVWTQAPKHVVLVESHDYTSRDKPTTILDQQYARKGLIEDAKQDGWNIRAIFVLGGPESNVERGRDVLRRAGLESPPPEANQVREVLKKYGAFEKVKPDSNWMDIAS